MSAEYEDPPFGVEGVWAECDCPGPPPEFLLPPPPRPPVLQPPDPAYCTEDPLPIETCDALPLIDASYRSSPSFQTSAVIVLCSVLLGLLVFIAVILIWKHKRKVQNFLPCKNSPQNNCDVSTAAAIYEDLHDVLPRPTPTHHHHHHAQLAGRHVVAPSIELIDVKSPPPAPGVTSLHYPSGYPISRRPPVFLCPSPGPDPYRPHPHHHHRGGGASHHLYEELSEPADDDLSEPPLSEDDFAEDELSLAGEADGRRLDGPPPPPYREEDELVMDKGGVFRRDVPRFRRPHEPLPPVPGNKRHKSLDRRRQEFHEGMLLDALLQLYPRVGSVEPPGGGSHGGNQQTSTGNRRVIPSITHRLQCMGQAPSAVGPYESVPVIGHHLATFRPLSNHHKPYSHDSAIGSDSGYSNHTAGTR